MTTVRAIPPSAENQVALGAITGIRFTEGVVVAIEGDDPVGPEAAGAVLVLQGTLDRDDKAQQFWGRAAMTLQAARRSPGFIRFIAFSEGLSHYALGFWRSHADAMAFRDSHAHVEAMRELDETGNQYGHFAGLFTTGKRHERHVYCDRCRHRNVVPRETCERCDQVLIDVFKEQAALAAQSKGAGH